MSFDREKDPSPGEEGWRHSCGIHGLEASQWTERRSVGRAAGGEGVKVRRAGQDG